MDEPAVQGYAEGANVLFEDRHSIGISLLFKKNTSYMWGRGTTSGFGKTDRLRK